MIKSLSIFSFVAGAFLTVSLIDEVEVSQEGSSYYLSIFAGKKEPVDLKPYLDAKAKEICPRGYVTTCEILGPFDDKGQAKTYYTWEIECQTTSNLL